MSERFDELINKQLDDRLLTQEGAAEITGVSVSSMKRYCRGAGTPSTYNASRIASAFGLEPRRVAEAIRNSEEGGG